MLRHEHYQEICAAASIGQATAEELAQLNEHLIVCQECRYRYSDFMEIQASQYASRTDEPAISAAETLGCIDSPLLRKRFLERAELEGITFSQIKADEPQTIPSVRLLYARRSPWCAMQVAAALLLLSCGIALGRYVANRRLASVYISDTRPNTQIAAPNELAGLMAKVSELETKNQGLTTDLETARATFARLSSHLAEIEASSTKSNEDRLRLSSSIKERDETIASLEDQTFPAFTAPRLSAS